MQRTRLTRQRRPVEGSTLVTADKERARIAKRASEFGVTNTIRFFSIEFVDRPLKESAVQTWDDEVQTGACQSNQT